MSMGIVSVLFGMCAEAALMGSPVLVAASQEAASEISVEPPAIEVGEAGTLPADQAGDDAQLVLGADAHDEILVSPEPIAEPIIVTDAEQDLEPLAFADQEDSVVVDKVFAALDGLSTLQGDFTQIAPSGAISTGTFYLRRPGLLRFEYDPPQPLLIVANGGMVYVHDDALETTDSYPVKRTPLKFLLRKSIELGDAKVVGVDRGIDTVAVTLASDDAATEGEISVILSAPTLTLKRWIVRDAQNGVTIVTLDNVVVGERIANRLFRAPDAGGQFLKK